VFLLLGGIFCWEEISRNGLVPEEANSRGSGVYRRVGVGAICVCRELNFVELSHVTWPWTSNYCYLLYFCHLPYNLPPCRLFWKVSLPLRVSLYHLSFFINMCVSGKLMVDVHVAGANCQRNSVWSCWFGWF